MNPAVLVLSYGSLSPLDIVESLLTEINQPKMLTTSSHESININFFKCDISNKYYTTSIFLIPFDGKLESVPAEIRKLTEALIINFDASDKSFINKISSINEFVDTNEIELGFLLTSSLTGKANELSFEELKECTNIVFDIVTLKEDTEESSEIQGYAEILEGITNFVWSNVKVKGSIRKQSSDNEELENQLNDFENLLITAQNLRSDRNLTRDEMLNKAEELAKIMSAILNDNDSD
ncbi:hypothetical protein KR222_011518 [Zaprionus bogoriensis]|nr:hypothetical protein KR222_011518 [Zaprionus bogoriensis]